MARQMVVNYGFSDIGPWSLLDPSAQSQDMIMRMMAKNSTSESLQMKIDEAVKKIADEAYEVALRHIRYRPRAMQLISGRRYCQKCSGLVAVRSGTSNVFKIKQAWNQLFGTAYL